MASEVIRLRVLKALSDVLEEVTFTYDGKFYAMVDKVFRGRNRFGPSDPIPLISVLEAPIPLDHIGAPADATVLAPGWELVVQGFAPDDPENPTDPGHVFLAMVMKRLAEERAKANWDSPEEGIFGLGRFVTSMYIGTGVVRPPDEVSEKAYFWLSITLDLAEDLADPYGD